MGYGVSINNYLMSVEFYNNSKSNMLEKIMCECFVPVFYTKLKCFHMKVLCI